MLSIRPDVKVAFPPTGADRKVRLPAMARVLIAAIIR